MYKTEFCDRAVWRDILGWVHHDNGEESYRTKNALDTLVLDYSAGKVGVVRESFSGQMVAAAYAAALHGGVVSIGAVRIDRVEILEHASQLLKGLLQTFADTNIELVQAIATEFTGLERKVLESVGLRYLAYLDHLVLFIDDETKAAAEAVGVLSQSAKGLTLRGFRDGDEQPLERVVSDSYIDTLDCPLLGNYRTGKAAVEGYLLGREQRHSWWLAEYEGTEVGCLLLWERAPAIWELTYMGIVPNVRGKKFGAVLLEAAIAVAAQHGAKQLVLSVDRDNHPATRLYLQRGFYCYNSTEVWFSNGDAVKPL
jgi:GNAT superfamily N-acetyltransferase